MSSSEASAADLASIKAMARQTVSLVSGFSVAFGVTLILVEIIVCSTVWYDRNAPIITALVLFGIFSAAFGITVRMVVIKQKKLLPDGFRLTSICSAKSSSEMASHVTNYKGLLVVSGILIIVLGTLTIYGDCMFPEIVAIIDFGLGIMGVFMGMGVGFVLAGIATIVAAYKPSKCWIVLSIVLNVITAGLSIALEIFIATNYFYPARDVVLATSAFQLLVIAAKLAPPFALVFLSAANVWAMLGALVRVGCRERDDMPMAKSLCLRPCTRTVLAVCGSGLFFSGLALTAINVSLPATGHFDYWQIFELLNKPSLAVAGMSFCTAIAALVVTRVRRSVTSTRLIVFLLGVATVGVAIFAMINAVELYNLKMDNGLMVQRNTIREVNGTMQFCACRYPETREEESYGSWRRYGSSNLNNVYACIDASKFCDGVVDLPSTDYRKCAGPQSDGYNNYYSDEKGAPDESSCFETWKPLFATQFGFIALSAVLGAVVAALNVRSLKAAVVAVLGGIEAMLKEMNGDKAVEEDREEILNSTAEEEQLNG